MNLLVDVSLKISIVLAVGLLASVTLRRSSASTRHWVLAASLACAAIMPVLSAALPAWPLPVADSITALFVQDALAPPTPSPVASGHVAVEVIASIADPPDVPRGTATIARWLGIVWFLGVALGGMFFLIGLARLAWLASKATPVLDGPWADVAQDVSRRYGLLRSVRLLRSTHPTLLVTWGALRPRVILPATTDGWPADRIRIVLGHELAHIRRRDWLVLVAGYLLRSVYWFNPIVWLAYRRLRQESEQACDDAVLSLGVSGSMYAEHLLDVARALRGQRTWVPAPAIARPSSLERRVTAMLNGHINRNPLPRSASIAAFIALVTMTLSVSRLDLTAQTFSTVSGVVVDAQRRLLPNATMTLVRTANGAKYEIRTDATGRYEFVGLPPGEYVIEGALAGFRPVRDRLAVSGALLTRHFTFEVGTLQETITVTGSPRASAAAPSIATREVRSAAELRSRFEEALARCNPSGSNPAVGGNIRPPRKIRDVRPVYPEGLRGAGVGGEVRLDALIGVDGRVREVQPAAGQAVDPELIAATTDAVRQWEFDGTLLNCVPVEVTMVVSVSFDPE